MRASEFQARSATRKSNGTDIRGPFSNDYGVHPNRSSENTVVTSSRHRFYYHGKYQQDKLGRPPLQSPECTQKSWFEALALCLYDLESVYDEILDDRYGGNTGD